MAGDVFRNEDRVTTDSLRARLARGESIEVAGYELAPALAAAVDGANLLDWDVPAATLHWLDVRAAAMQEPPPAASRQISAWRARGITVCYKAVVGDPFWTTQEITEVPQLIAATMACIADSG